MYVTPEDIANKALQHLGATQITLLSDNSRNAAVMKFAYDKCRRAELRANPWNFAARRVALRSNPFLGVIYPAWSAFTAYHVGDVVGYAANNQSAAFICVTANNAQTPVNNTLFWLEFNAPVLVPVFATTPTQSIWYYPGEVVAGSDGNFYVNTTGAATNLDPLGGSATPPPWHMIPGATSFTYAVLAPTQFTTASAAATPFTPFKNLFPLPSGYLRNMSQDPKTAGTSAQLTTGGSQALDFEYENGYLLSANPGPLIFRFGADVQAVTVMDDLFCAALACRIALDTAEIITQSPAKIQVVKALYDQAIDEAVRINAIEAGSTEPRPVDTRMSRNPSLMEPPKPVAVRNQ